MNDDFRPQCLAEVAARTIERPKPFADNLSEFLDDFYLDSGAESRQRRLADRPHPTGDAEIDMWLGAAGEHLAQRWGLEIPAWTQEPEFLAVNPPKFYPASPKMRPMLIVESPPAFRRRFLFTLAEPLMRARFPGEKARMPFLDKSRLADPI